MPLEKVAHCEVCGTDLIYKTKKPKLCSAHKLANAKPNKKPKTIPTKSKKEGQMQYLLNKIMPEAVYIDNGFYSFLPSPKDHPMQMDRYYPDLKLAFEFQGKQHYQFNSYMHSSKESFEYLKTCDALKAKLLKQRGIRLITIKYDKEITLGYLVRRLKEEGILDDLRQKTTVREELGYQ